MANLLYKRALCSLIPISNIWYLQYTNTGLSPQELNLSGIHHRKKC